MKAFLAVLAALVLSVEAAAAPILGPQHFPTVAGVATVTVYDSTNDPLWNDPIRDATAAWSQLSPDLELNVVAGACLTGTATVCVKEGPLDGWWAYSYWPGDWTCCTSNVINNLWVVIDPANTFGLDQPTRTQVFKHELGHAFSLAHEFGSGSLMDYCWGCPTALEPNTDEIATIHSIYSTPNEPVSPPKGSNKPKPRKR